MKFTFSKLYNTEAEGGGGAATATQISPAEALAQYGTKTDGSNTVLEPIVIKKEEEKPVDTKVEEPAATAKPETKVETAKETPTQVKVEETKVETKQADTPTPQPTLAEVLKSQQPETVLKAMGFDDKVIKLVDSLKGFENVDYFSGLLNEWKTNGNVNGYLKELTTDYTKMPAEEVMRHQLRQEYPKASERQLDALYKKEVVQVYSLDSDDKDELEEGQALLEAKADKYRDTFVENQKKFLMPKAPEPSEPAASSQDLQREQNLQQFQSAIEADQYIKDLAVQKSLVFGEGDDKYTFPIENPQELKELITDGDKWAEAFFNPVKQADGSIKLVPDFQKQILVSAVLKYGNTLFTDLAKHYKALGGKAAIADLENAKQPDNNNTAQPDAQPTTVAGAMAKQGRLVSGGS